VSLANVSSAQLEITCADSLPVYQAIESQVKTGDQVTLRPENGDPLECHDPQDVLSNLKIVNGAITGTVTGNVGDHLLFALTRTGQTQQWRMFKLHVTDPVTAAAEAAKVAADVPPQAKWNLLDISAQMNADVRQIFQQKYLSPRPNTCSLRLATDGYSTWQMVLDPKNKVPEIDFANIASLRNKSGQIQTSKGVPFIAPGDAKNIAFTSRWDNFPKQIEVPINQSGEAIWFLVCGSTNPMECGIANAEVRLNYADGSVDKLELTPPVNFWSLCPFGHVDYNYERDGFCLPKIPPETLQLGSNCRAIVLGRRLAAGKVLKSVTMETLSEQVVIGLMAATVMNPNAR
jgi:hypothetical protein